MTTCTTKKIDLLRIASLVVLLLVSLSTFACANSDLYTLQDNMRQLQIGDRWNYDYTASPNIDDVYKTGVVEVLSDTVTSPTGTQLLQLQEFMVYYYEGHDKHISDLFIQDSSGNINYYGYTGWASNFPTITTKLIAVPTTGFVTMFPGTFYVGLNWNREYKYVDATNTYIENYTVVGKETITVKAGTFETYKISYTYDSGWGFGWAGDMWFAPQLGNCVKSITDDGRLSIMELTDVSFATHVPEPSSILALLSGLAGFGIVLRRRR